MKRFQWKVVALMLIVSTIPLLFSIAVVNQLLKDTVALGFDESLDESITVAIDTHRNYIQARRRALALETGALAHDPALARLLDADRPAPEDLRGFLTRWGDRIAHPHMQVAAVSLRIANGADELEPAVIDRRDTFPEELWRGKREAATVLDPKGRTWALAVDFVVPWALFKEYEGLGEVQRTFSNLDRRQVALTSGYTQTFVVISGAILLVTFLAGFLWSRATIGRLGRLARATSRVGRGDLDVQVPVVGRDEIAQLTRAFNEMVVEVRQSRARLAYLERVSTWQEIARRLAHEIKNPLTPILLAVQQLDRKYDDYLEHPERYRRLVSDAMEIVSEEVDSLRKLVREFGDFARLPKVAPEITDAADFVRDVVRTNPQFAPHVDLDAIETATVAVGIDRTMMRRALINLIENAQQAIDAAGTPPAGSIQIRVEALGGAVIVIEDVGPGVLPEHLDRLFDPYFTTKSEGTGLGLAIVKKIVLDHGGDIRVESPLTARGGTRFCIALPPIEDDPAPIG